MVVHFCVEGVVAETHRAGACHHVAVAAGRTATGTWAVAERGTAAGLIGHRARMC